MYDSSWVQFAVVRLYKNHLLHAFVRPIFVAYHRPVGVFPNKFVRRYLGVNFEVMHGILSHNYTVGHVRFVWHTSNSNVTVLSCDNTGSMTDDTVTYPIVLNLPPTDVKVPRSVAGRMSSPRPSATLAEISPVPVHLGSSRILITKGLPLTSLVRATVTGCLLLLLELVLTANTSGP